jgi:hypothetical protein
LENPFSSNAKKILFQYQDPILKHNSYVFLPSQKKNRYRFDRTQPEYHHKSKEYRPGDKAQTAAIPVRFFTFLASLSAASTALVPVGPGNCIL